MDKKDMIRAEIERHRQAIRVLNEHTTPEQMSKTCTIFQYSDSILSALLSFLDTLESEKPMEREKMEREEELKKAVHQVSEEIVKEIFPDDLESGDFFTEIDLKNCITRVAYQFADWQKEQMMKDAAEGEVVKDISNKLAVTAKINLDGFKFGDKVRIIIVKEEQQ